ncbi:MAG TPA: chorismate-binding protein, partial [Gammaproteobacteria bacterium]|nr:chorismate-binding protein [Gammaproteobacteria bacterium]
MVTPRITELEHWDAVAQRFSALSQWPWRAWLDSATGAAGSAGSSEGLAPGATAIAGKTPAQTAARYDILVADPYVRLRTRGAVTEIAPRGGAATTSARPPLDLVREQLGELCPLVPGLPFFGGAVGYLSYDLGRRFERMPAIAAADIGMPELAIGIYDWAVIVDRAERRTWLAGLGRDPLTFARWPELVERLHRREAAATQPFRVLSRPAPEVSRAEYAAAFARVQQHIRRGDCYQVNLTQRFSARADGDAWHAYLRLREINPAPFAAFLAFPDGKVLSSSPERFLRVEHGRVETKPIKGTRPRAADPARDRALAEELRASAKDRAENVMIVD